MKQDSLDKMAIAMQVSDIAQRLLDAQEKQNEIISDLLNSVQEYADLFERQI